MSDLATLSRFDLSTTRIGMERVLIRKEEGIRMKLMKRQWKEQRSDEWMKIEETGNLKWDIVWTFKQSRIRHGYKWEGGAKNGMGAPPVRTIHLMITRVFSGYELSPSATRCKSWKYWATLLNVGWMGRRKKHIHSRWQKRARSGWWETEGKMESRRDRKEKELNEKVWELRRAWKKLAEHTQRTRSVSVLSQSLMLSHPSLPAACWLASTRVASGRKRRSQTDETLGVMSGAVSEMEERSTRCTKLD